MGIADAGYNIYEEVLTASECDRLVETLSQALPTRGRAGSRHLMSHTEVSALASEPRLVDIASAILNRPAVPFRATLFDKSGDANWLVPWHQDTALPLARRFARESWGPWSEKAGVVYAHAPAWALERVVALRVHLDASTQNNGPLRVIPGSQTAGVMTDAQVQEVAHAEQFVDCVVSRGGVLAMRPLIIHASSKGSSGNPRRVLHIEYADTLALAEDTRLAIA